MHCRFYSTYIVCGADLRKKSSINKFTLAASNMSVFACALTVNSSYNLPSYNFFYRVVTLTTGECSFSCFCFLCFCFLLYFDSENKLRFLRALATSRHLHFKFEDCTFIRYNCRINSVIFHSSVTSALVCLHVRLALYLQSCGISYIFFSVYASLPFFAA